MGEDTYEMPPHGWTCFHCGETFKTYGAARDHFGFEPSADPACRIKAGYERGLVMALRAAQQSAAEAWTAVHNENSQICQAWRRGSASLANLIQSAEEEGYAKGLEDARRELTRERATNA